MVRFTELVDEVKKGNEYLNAIENFKPTLKQWDVEFIKWCKSFEEVKTLAEENDIDVAQAVYHWVQYISNKMVIEMFADYNCTPVNPSKENDGGIEINGKVLFPVQIMYKNSQNPENLGSRTGKDDYIRAIYQRDIKNGVKTLKNKLFIVYPSENTADYRKNRLNLGNLASKIYNFVNYYKKNDVNKLEFKVGDTDYTFYSDVIVM